MNFSEWLLEEITKREWTNAELAKKSALSRQAIGYYLEGRTPNTEALTKIARAFNVSLDEVLRHANILPAVSERDEYLKRIEHKLSKINDPDDRATIEGMIDLLSPDKKRKGDKRVPEQ